MNIVLCIFARIKVECTSNVASRWRRHLSLSQGGWSDQSWSYTIDSFCPLKDNFTPMFECGGCGMFFREEPSHTKPKVVTLTTVDFNLIACIVHSCLWSTYSGCLLHKPWDPHITKSGGANTSWRFELLYVHERLSGDVGIQNWSRIEILSCKLTKGWNAIYASLKGRLRRFFRVVQSQPQLRFLFYLHSMCLVEEWLWHQKSFLLVVNSVNSTVMESLSKSSFLHEVLSRFSPCAA